MVPPVDGLLDGLLLGELLGAPEDGLDGLLEDGADGNELVPEDGAVLLELGERVAELEPLLPDEPLWPELSQAASDKAESTAAAISHFLSIRLSPFRLTVSRRRPVFSAWLHSRGNRAWR